jgi:hypothetical protein
MVAGAAAASFTMIGVGTSAGRGTAGRVGSARASYAPWRPARPSRSSSSLSSKSRARLSVRAASDPPSVGGANPDEFIKINIDKEFLTGGGDDGSSLGSQADAVVKGNTAAVLERSLATDGGAGDLDYLQELIAIQGTEKKNIGFFGTRNMGFLHQQLVEILSYALVLTENHIFTSGATGTNAAVIRGALRAERPDLLTVILPQSVEKQPEESRELLEQVENVISLKYDSLPLGEASRKCNDDIISRVQQIICFAFHDSNLLLDTCHEAKMLRKIVCLFYLD